MKTKVCSSLFALCLMFLATPLLTNAQSEAANGSYRFIMEDELAKYVEFDARTDERGYRNTRPDRCPDSSDSG